MLYAVSVSGRAYDFTSPVTMPHHEVVRKTYAVLAFALLGFALERSNLRRLHGLFAAGAVLTAYSYAIELGQIAFKHSTETFAEHAFDVASGFAGGALGAFAAVLIAVPEIRARRIEAIALIAIFAALAWAFTATFGRLD